MFGLFKSLTPEQKFEKEIKQGIETLITKYIAETQGVEIIKGLVIESATRDAYKAYIDEAYFLARGYEISYNVAVIIITNSTNEIRFKYLEDPEYIL